MEILSKTLVLDNSKYYITHLNLVNVVLFLGLEPREIEVLATLMALDKKITEGDVLNSFARKKVKEILNMSAASLTNHIKSLTRKKVLLKNSETGRYQLEDYLFLEPKEQKYKIILKNNEA